ncbi:MAG: sodium-transporting two-sector ATPase [Candidatus Saccharimonadales bacterium]
MANDVKKHFQRFVDSGLPVGEVIAVNKFLVSCSGLQPVNLHALITFDDDSKGFVQQILPDRVLVLHMGTSKLRVGSLAVVQHPELMAKVGKDLVGRVISVTGEPLDGKGAIASDGSWPIFKNAPPIYEREMLSQQLETGITIIDALFPIVRGQRLALLGDSKSGKSTLATQIAINQRTTDQVVVYVLVAKRRSDIDTLINRLSENSAMEKAVVVVSTIFDSLVLSYLAPYVGCAIAEYLWQTVGVDTVVIYDDLTSHAQAYREIALLSGTSPGRDSYPGDMFHAHSTLLERAGRLNKNHKCLTAIPLVLADGGDVTGYLPTNVMSITDGQWVLDMDIFRNGLRPAVSPGLSVTRIGGRGHNDRQKQQSAVIFETLAAYTQAQEFSHFGSEMALTTSADMVRGQKLYGLLTQIPGETYSLIAQQLMLDIALEPSAIAALSVEQLKKAVADNAALVSKEEDYEHILEQLKSQALNKEVTK